MLAPLYLSALLGTAYAAAKACRARDLPAIEVFGIEVIDIHAKETRGFEEWGPAFVRTPPAETRPIDFCNITITYTHPGQNDSVNVYVWLPLDGWNGRLIGQGGGGFAASSENMLPSGVSEGYVTANTDAGHTNYADMMAQINPSWWISLSPGNINWVQLQNFASRALDDLPKIAKEVIKGYYGESVKYAYWNGCSTGGRQGVMSAQRFPANYDGILAGCPAINWASMAMTGWWPQLQMRKLSYYPPQCEFDAITRAAIESCDELDGVKDGIVAAPGLCNFDATSTVGQAFDCQGDSRKITKEAAQIINSFWAGPTHPEGDKRQGWYGSTHETVAAGPSPFSGLAGTRCNEDNKNCQGMPFPIVESWIRYFVMKDAEYDVTNMSEDDFWRVLHKSRTEFTSVIDTSDPDLSDFKATGAKMITWHGLADQLIPPNGTTEYYDRVLALDADAPSYYRHFEAPGVAHCNGGAGAYPHSMFQSLIDWVENGVAPEKLDAKTTPMEASQPIKARILCPYPQVAAYVGGDVNDAGSFECADSFSVAKRHSEL